MDYNTVIVVCESDLWHGGEDQIFCFLHINNSQKYKKSEVFILVKYSINVYVMGRVF